jgi:uncharacterized protein
MGDDLMTTSAIEPEEGRRMQDRYYVVQMTTRFNSLEDVRVEAAETMAAHLARSQRLHEEGVLLMAGAFLDGPGEQVQTMGVLTSRAAAEDYARNDPFVVAGQVESWVVREWANMLR